MRVFSQSFAAFGLMLVCQSAVRGELSVHEDYYAGFSQGAYYGLLLAGEEYEVAWCMRGELVHEAKGMGQGAEFQKTMERLLENCRKTHRRSAQQ
jgi:malonyl CoA-acyl carrier protein transacylase